MAPSQANDPLTPIELDGDEPRYWSEDELASFITHPGVGRILSVRTGGRDRLPIESCLTNAGYQVGRLPITEDPVTAPQSAATFLPDLIYITLSEPKALCLGTLESLASDQRTQMIPLVALVPPDASPALVEEAYSRSGCDFFRMETNEVELLARTHVLVRLSRAAMNARVGSVLGRSDTEAANVSNVTRLDLCDEQTGAYTAAYFVHRLPTEVSRARRYQRDLSLLCVRCPQATKQDQVAVRAARIIQGHVRSVDLVGRIEPGLFAVLLPETRANRVSALAARIANELGREQIHNTIGTAGLDIEDEGGVYTAMGLLQAAAKRATNPEPDVAG